MLLFVSSLDPKYRAKLVSKKKTISFSYPFVLEERDRRGSYNSMRQWDDVTGRRTLV